MIFTLVFGILASQLLNDSVEDSVQIRQDDSILIFKRFLKTCFNLFL